MRGPPGKPGSSTAAAGGGGRLCVCDFDGDCVHILTLGASEGRRSTERSSSSSGGAAAAPTSVIASLLAQADPSCSSSSLVGSFGAVLARADSSRRGGGGACPMPSPMTSPKPEFCGRSPRSVSLSVGAGTSAQRRMGSDAAEAISWRAAAPGPLPACGSADDGLGLRRDPRTSGEVSIDHVTTPPTPNSRLRRSRSRSPEPEPQPSPSMPVAEGSRSLDAETPAGDAGDGAAMDRSTI